MEITYNVSEEAEHELEKVMIIKVEILKFIVKSANKKSAKKN